MSYNKDLQSNNTDLRDILDTINDLPDADSIPGENGATFTPSVSEDGVLSWTNDKGLDNPDPVNIKGEPGENGKDGANGADGKDGEPGADGKDGEPGADGKDGEPGADGKDGVSVTHSWNGTILTVTSASGTSSADLKGEKGDKGDTGAQGIQGETGPAGENGKDGENGKTPYIQNNYWYINGINTNIKAEGKDGVDGKDGLNATPVAPLFANDISECTDITKPYVLPDGFIYAYMLTEKEIEGGPTYVNALDGTTKYINQRWSHSGKKYSSAIGYMATDKLVVSADQIVYVNLPLAAFTGNYPRIHYFDISGNYVTTQDSSAATIHKLTTDADGITSWVVGYQNATAGDNNTNAKLANADNITHMVIVFHMSNVLHGGTDSQLTESEVANVIVSIGNPIVEGGGTEIITEYAWTNTGHAFVSADYNDRLSSLEDDVDELRDLITNGDTDGDYTNVLPLAEMGDDQSLGWLPSKGYTANARISASSGSVATNVTTVPGLGSTGYIRVKVNDVVRLKNFYGPNGISTYVVAYDSNKMPLKYKTWGVSDLTDSFPWATYHDWYTVTGDEISSAKSYTNVTEFTLTEEDFGTNIEYIRISGVFDHDNSITIITLNEEIKGDNNADSSVSIEEWDMPIYDANIPVFELEVEKAAMTNAACTPSDIYAKYDALMAEHPHYITKTDLGLCSDGVNHVYRYDFREPDSRHTTGYSWSETKAKAIIVSGIHYEWAGIYGLYYALEEIAENPSLYNLRRNTHLIVIPCVNPYCTIASNYDSSIGVLNANGVQIHRNFEVGFIYPGQSGYVEAGNRNHGGTAPLSEIETQYVDNVMKQNTDAAFFLTCHNFGEEGFNFIWPSVATKYMCNMGYRLIDKLSNAWLKKFSASLVGIEDYRTDDIPSWDNRLGFAHISRTDGTETRQATKYGIQGANVEICGRFWVHGTKANPEPSMSSFTMSRGAEVYVNFLLTAFGVYDPKDKALYNNG